MASTQLLTALDLGCGAFWTIAYVLIIIRGFQDRTYGMPSIALGMNLTWEFAFSFVYYNPACTPPRLVTIPWLLIDLIIAYQYLRFGRREFAAYLPEKLFLPQALLKAVCLSSLVYLALAELADPTGSLVAYFMNTVMSYLFIDMLIRRGSCAGQSIYIALCKLAGSALSSLRVHWTIPHGKTLHLMFILVLILDVIYLVLLYRKFIEKGQDPWRLRP